MDWSWLPGPVAKGIGFSIGFLLAELLSRKKSESK